MLFAAIDPSSISFMIVGFMCFIIFIGIIGFIAFWDLETDFATSSNLASLVSFLCVAYLDAFTAFIVFAPAVSLIL